MATPILTHDLIIIGAGISGIIAAQRYLDIHPTTNLTILEKDDCIGGVFSRRRMYNTFWTQWTVGLSEFSDLPMQRPPEEDCRYDFYRAKWTTDYLETYVERKNGSGHTLRDVMRFGTEVENVKKVDGKWVLACKDSAGSLQTFYTEKLMIAAGTTTIPNMPSFQGAETFGGPILHSIDFGAREDEILKSENIKSIAIIGGGKSSADMLYEAVKAGKAVSWIIRTSGIGAPFFISGKGLGPYKNAFEAGSTRAAASINPSLLNKRNWWTKFLHETVIGAGLLRRIMEKLDGGARSEADYKGRKSDRGFEKLDYDAPFFWQGGGGGILHHEDFWDLVAKNVFVYRDEIESLSQGVIKLMNGEELQSDAILCGTGWAPSMRFFDQEERIRLGLPYEADAEPALEKEKWSKLDTEADTAIASTYPFLSSRSPPLRKPAVQTPYRLYLGILPINDPTVLFMNYIEVANKILGAEIQAMWAVAYFDGQIKIPSLPEMERSVAKWVAFSRRRYLLGVAGNNLTFECIQYADALMADMQLKAHAKGWWWKRNLETIWPRDYGRAWDEYKKRVGVASDDTGKNKVL